MAWVVALAVVLGAVTRASAIPSPQSLNSSLSLLIDNDLQGAGSPQAGSAVLLLEARQFSEASEACAAVGEQLWVEPSDGANVQPVLDFLAYEENTLGFAQFWIAPTDADAAPTTIDINGTISQLGQEATELPVLCTQSAPFSSESTSDTSAKWQVSVSSNNENLIGFHDCLSFRFLGVRYAPQPKRFTYSTLYAGNGSAVSATKFSPQCVQGSTASESEDCLFLNIWTTYLPGPTSSEDKLKPVLFWIHGGAFTSGTGSDATFDGGNFASRGDVVVVTINYRVSTFGYLALDDSITKGNFGLADQINALDWVRKNIADFGGDPDRITISGQSAGAGSVRALIASPKSIGKFAGAIPLSNLGGLNYGTTYSKYPTIDEQLDLAGNAVLSATNCTGAVSQVDCLRAIPPATLSRLPTPARFLVVDGTYLVTDQLELEGPPLPVNIMMGITRDDGAPFISYPTNQTNATAYLASQGYPRPDPALFPLPQTTNNATLDLFNVTDRLSTDAVFRCIDQATVYAGLENGRFPSVYFYEFNRTYQFTGWPHLDVCEPPKTAARPDGDPDGEYFKCHSGELYYVFGNLGRQNLPLRDEFDLPFEQFVLDSFSSFVRTYDPNPELAYLKARSFENTISEIEGVARWVPSTKGEMTMRTLQWPSFQGSFIEGQQCESLGLGLDYYLTES